MKLTARLLPALAMLAAPLALALVLCELPNDASASADRARIEATIETPCVAQLVRSTEKAELATIESAAAVRETSDDVQEQRAAKVDTASSRGIELVVVDADGEPVAGARVLHGGLHSEMPQRGCFESYLSDAGKALTTDARGAVLLPADTVLVCAADGEHYAERVVLGRRSTTVELVRDPALRVQVLSAAQPLSNARVTARTAERSIDLGRTSAQGALVVRASSSLGAQGSVCFVAEELGATSVELDLEQLPAAVTIEGPAVGSLAVTVLNADGEAASGTPLRLEAEGSVATARTDASGNAVFAHVAVGGSFELVATAQGASVSQRVNGPAMFGGQAAAELRLDARPVRLSGLAVDASGRPLADRELLLEGTIARTDAAGAFRFELSEASDMGAARIELIDRDGLRGAASASVAVTGEGDVHVGTLRFAETPLVAAGRVQGAAHDLRGLKIAVEHTTDGSEWTRARGIGVRTSGARRFELRGTVPAGALRLRIDGAEFLPVEPQPFTAGETELVVEVERGGMLVANIESERALVATLVSEELGSVRRSMARPNGQEGSRLAWNGLEAGSYRFVLREPARTEPLVELDGIVVERGAPVRDARLASIVVR